MFSDKPQRSGPRLRGEDSQGWVERREGGGMRPAAAVESAKIGYCRNTSSIFTNVFQYFEHALIWFVL